MLLERHREQKGKEDLHARQGNPELLKELAKIAIQAFVFRLFPSRWPISHGSKIGKSPELCTAC
jgi:hypothetical protein